ncbi:Negative regulator of mitotic exit [Rhizophlyctis rosea]|nr:Negative regulator of mitotic exit [Rhizophlyctis rosea]
MRIGKSLPALSLWTLIATANAQVASDGTLSASYGRANGAFVALKDRIVIYSGAYTNNFVSNDSSIVASTTPLETNMTVLTYADLTVQDKYITPPASGYNPLAVEYLKCDTNQQSIFCFGGYPTEDTTGVLLNYISVWNGTGFDYGQLPKIRGRYRTPVAVLGNQYYIYGGYVGGSEDLSDMYAVDLTNYIAASVNPTSTSNPPPLTDACMLAVSPSHLILFSGYHHSDSTHIRFNTNFYVYDSNTNLWTDLSQQLIGIPPNREAPACAVSNDGHVYYFGGANAATGALNDLSVLDLKTLQWTTLAKNSTGGGEVPTARWGSHLAVVGKWVVLYGGYNTWKGGNWFADDKKIYFFDTEKRTWVNPSALDNSFKSNPTVGPPTSLPITYALTGGVSTASPNPSPSSTTSVQSDKQSSGGPNIGGIVGGVIAVVLVFAIGVVGVIFYRRRNRSVEQNVRARPESSTFHVPPAPVVQVHHQGGYAGVPQQMPPQQQGYGVPPQHQGYEVPPQHQGYGVPPPQYSSQYK